MKQWMKKSLSRQLAVWLGLVLLGVSVLIYLPLTLYVQQSSVRSVAQKNQQSVIRVSHLVEAYIDDLLEQGHLLNRSLAHAFADSWSLSANGDLLNAGNRVELQQSLLDRFATEDGLAATIFVRHADEFVRIATTVRNDRGERVVHSMLAHESPAYQALMQGKAYRGWTQLFGSDFIADYEPIKDAQGQLIGCLFSAENAEQALASLIRSATDEATGKTGFVSIVQIKDQGHVRAYHFPGHEAGNLEDDAVLGAWAKSLTADVQEGSLNYTDTDGARLLYYVRFKGMPWYIVASQTTAEMLAQVVMIRNSIILATLLLIGMSLLLLVRLLNLKLIRPLDEVIAVFNGMATGRLDHSINDDGEDEIAHLRRALKGMQAQLSSRVEQDRVQLAESNRIVVALNATSNGIMMTDMNGVIIFVNSAIDRMFRDKQQSIRHELPAFDLDRLVGTNIDVFHKHPAHQRGIMERLNGTHVGKISIGPYHFRLTLNPILNESTRERMGYVVEWADMTDILRKEIYTQRILSSLDSSSTNIIIADAAGVIIYINGAFRQTFRDHQDEIRKDLPHFDIDKVVGSNIDVFHKHPQHQRRLLSEVKGMHRSNIRMGRLHFRLTLNPIRAEGTDTVLGYVVEWLDQTQERAIESEIDGVMQAILSGDLTARTNLDGKSGFFASVSKGINEMVQVMEGVITDVARVLQGLAQGRLDQTIDNAYQGLFGQLREDVNRSIDQLAEVVRQIRESAQSVARGASEIAQGNQDLSQRTEEQAASLEETASSMEEMTSVVKQTADNANRVNTLASTTRDEAQAAGQVVDRAVVAMEAINSSSKRIADIIGVIDEIAFQTNLLALNAAVEAARAGEQGRGFAVVAGEVRNLAQRSAAAAREIKELIRDSVAKVADGSDLVHASGKTLGDIVQAVERVSSMISEISSAAREQSMGIEQVNVAISQMDQMTQQNAALVEQAAAAGESMSEQARTMLGVVQFFKLSERSREDFVPHARTQAPSVQKGMKQQSEDWDEF